MGVSGAFWKHLGASGVRVGLLEPSARARWGAPCAPREVLRAFPILLEASRRFWGRLDVGRTRARALGPMVGFGAGRLWPCQRASGRAMGLCRGLTLGLSWALVVARVRGL